MPEQFRFSTVRVTSTASVTLLEVSTASTAVVRTITVCNTSTASTSSVDIEMFIVSETANFLMFRNTQLSASQTFSPAATPIVISAGNAIKISRTGENLDATASYLELS